MPWCEVGVGVTPFSKLPYLREFSNIWFQKLTDISCKRSLWTVFWKFQKPFIWILVGGFNFRLGTYNVPPGSSATSLTTSSKRELNLLLQIVFGHILLRSNNPSFLLWWRRYILLRAYRDNFKTEYPKLWETRQFHAKKWHRKSYNK